MKLRRLLNSYLLENPLEFSKENDNMEEYNNDDNIISKEYMIKCTKK
jgi:hypothetical protein